MKTVTLDQLFMWHREQAERFAWLADNHKTTGGDTRHRAGVTRRNQKLAAFHADAASVLKLMMPNDRRARAGGGDC